MTSCSKHNNDYETIGKGNLTGRQKIIEEMSNNWLVIG